MDRLQLYHRLPYAAKVLAASWHGRRLARRRYDAETEDRVAEALEREHWSERAWHRFQQDRLRRLLRRAAERVPFYRRLRRHGAGSVERLSDWPILEKEQVRSDPEAFLADDVDRRSLYPEHTSGSTGKPLRLYWSPHAVKAWYALVEARSRRAYRVSRHDRWAMLGGRLVADVRRDRPPFWVWNAGMSQLYLSSYHLAPSTVAAYIDAVRRHRIVHLFGYSSALGSLASLALAENVDLSGLVLKVAVTNAEPLFEHQRQAVEEAFGCPVRETYGLAELAAAAGECEAGHLHWWPEVGYVEVLDEAGDPVAPGQSGDLVATGLLNDAQPLIRYRVGDRVRVPEDPAAPCPCGRALPRLESLEGRLDDVIFGPDGKEIGRLDTVFKGDLPIREAQIIQDRPGALSVLYVATPELRPRHVDELRNRVLRHVGDMEIDLRSVQQIPRSANGKFRAVVNRLR